MRARIAVGLVALALPCAMALAQDKGEKTAAEKLREEMAKEAKRFLDEVKLPAKDATLKAEQAQPGIVVGLRPEKHVRLPDKKDSKDKKDKPKDPNDVLKKKEADKNGQTKDSDKEQLFDCFQILVVKEQEPEKPKEPEEEPNPKAPPKPPEKPKPVVWLAWHVEIDPESKPVSKQLKDELERDAQNCARRIAAAGAKVSVRAAVEKVQAFAKGAAVVAVLLDDRENKAPPKAGETPREDWLVYAVVGEAANYYLVDVVSGDVRKKS